MSGDGEPGRPRPGRAASRRPPRRPRRDAEANRERVLAAAAAAMLREGRNVPLAAIAAEAGVGVGTLYRRYADRKALLHALEYRAYRLLNQILDEIESTDLPGLDAVAQYLSRTLGIADQLGPAPARRAPADDRRSRPRHARRSTAAWTASSTAATPTTASAPRSTPPTSSSSARSSPSRCRTARAGPPSPGASSRSSSTGWPGTAPSTSRGPPCNARTSSTPSRSTPARRPRARRPRRRRRDRVSNPWRPSCPGTPIQTVLMLQNSRMPWRTAPGRNRRS